jgi:hypothetical protein
MRDIPKTRLELKEKVIRYINKGNNKNSCWEWTGCLHHSGYGVIQFKNIQYQAHRLMYQFFVGSIPEGLLVCHKCDNPRCCNPAHLFIGTPKENSQDMVKKGRALFGDRNPSRIFPERRPRGANHWTKLKPTNILRGSENPKAKLTERNVIEIRKLRKDGIRIKDLSTRFGVSETHIKYIIYRKSWVHI